MSRSLLIVALVLPLALSAGFAQPARACETAGQPFVVVVDRTIRIGDMPSYTIGEITRYTINCAPPNSPILWSSTLNGASTGEVNVFYGHYTDANGRWSASAGSPWMPPHRGAWVKTATIGGQDVSVSFKVVPSLTMSGFVDGLYTAGQSPTYTITGAPPNSPIYWSSTLNGVSTGEVNAFYGHYTDYNGFWTATGGAWQSQHVGGWTKTATVGNAIPVSAGFQVVPSTELVTQPSGTTVFNNFSNRAGVYHWTNQRLIDDGANKLASIGGHALRLLFTVGCNPQQSLVDLLLSSEMQEAFGNANLKTFVLTTFDRKVCGNNAKIFVDPTLYDDVNEYNALVADYRELTKRLYQSYQGTGKRFIISNWEGDNVVYCSAAFYYATDPPTRAACDANYSIFYKQVPNPATALQGFKRWLQARSQGVQEGRNWAVANGYSGVDVYYAVEFNIVRALKQPSCGFSFNSLTCTGEISGCTPYTIACPPGGGYPSVLCDAMPQVAFDYASYSAYESTNVSPSQLTADLDRIRNHLGTSNIIIGEFGFPQTSPCSTPQNVRQRTHNVLNAALNWGVPYIFQWVLFDNNEFGVFNYALQPQPMACYYQNRFAGFGYPWGSCN